MSTHPKFGPLPDATGIDIVDPIETRHFSVVTDGPVSPADGDPNRFAFPVANACRIRTGHLEFSSFVPMDVRTPDGDHLGSVDLPTRREFPDGEYLLELHSPIKLYLLVSGGMAIDATDDGARIQFDGEVPVEIGARSYHSAPAATITVPDDPEAVMAAVSAFPSALKTTSPERSWPTLRGHPPRIERGDELSIPDALEVPDAGITISVPPEYGHVYTVAPLAYYLGAEVVPGETTTLSADSGVARNLGDDVAVVGESVEALLKRTFLLDCVVRTEGLYPTDLHERGVLESHVDLDFAALYEASPADRLAAYLAVPDEAVEAISSPWHRVTHVESDPGPDAAELLPYVVNDLSLVRVKEVGDEEWSPTAAQQQTDEALDAFVRSPATADGEDDFLRSASADGEDDFLRSADRRRFVRRNDGLETPGSDGDADHGGEDARHATCGVPGEGGYIPLPETDALEQAWVGERTPIEGTKLLKSAFEHDATASEDGTVEITVVCNDEQMREELDTAAEIYGDREDVRTDVTAAFGVTTDDLRDLLAEESDMFHFVGHIDGLGFQCPDGVLDAETLDGVGATTVLLNGCRSHDQGVALVEAGARAAVVSLGDLWNEGAVEVGETLARLFHHGFSIGHAMTIVREYTSLGKDYVVLGDPGVTMAQCANLLPSMFHLTSDPDEELGPDEVVVETHTYPVRGFGIGSMFRIHLPQADSYHVAVGAGDKMRVTIETLQRAFAPISEPMIVDGELVWSDSWSGI